MLVNDHEIECQLRQFNWWEWTKNIIIWRLKSIMILFWMQNDKILFTKRTIEWGLWFIVPHKPFGTYYTPLDIQFIFYNNTIYAFIIFFIVNISFIVDYSSVFVCMHFFFLFMYVPSKYHKRESNVHTRIFRWSECNVQASVGYTRFLGFQHYFRRFELTVPRSPRSFYFT